VEGARAALRVVSEISESLLGHLAAIQVATWGSRSDLSWLAAYIEAVGLVAAFREAFFSVERAAQWVERAALQGEGNNLQEAEKALKEATALLQRAQRAIRPNILSVAISALSRGDVSEAQLAMLQASFLAAQGWLRRCVGEAGRALEAAGRALVSAKELELGRRFSSLSGRERGLVAELAVRRLGGNLNTLLSLLERGLPFGTACLLLGASSETGNDPLTLAAKLPQKWGPAAPLLEEIGVFAPDMALLLSMLEKDISEATSLP